MIEYQSGFGNNFSTEAEEGALPRTQNTPRKAPLGLFPEQINGTCFTVPATHNRRTWMYRIRPSVTESPYERLLHPSVDLGYLEARPQPNLLGWKPAPLEGNGDFVDGLVLVGGAGDPAELRGMAAYVYVAHEDMEERSFHSTDGDLLILPDTGGLTIRTECGVLEVDPGQLAIVPRGIKMSVARRGAEIVRGYVGESFGRHFELPSRGVVGANSLADARHFEAPTASYEDRGDATFRVTAKVGGVLYEATRPGSPFDVVAWHGNHTPYRYDLSRFSPVGSVDVDHPDPLHLHRAQLTDGSSGRELAGPGDLPAPLGHRAAHLSSALLSPAGGDRAERHPDRADERPGLLSGRPLPDAALHRPRRAEGDLRPHRRPR